MTCIINSYRNVRGWLCRCGVWHDKPGQSEARIVSCRCGRHLEFRDGLVTRIFYKA